METLNNVLNNVSQDTIIIMCGFVSAIVITCVMARFEKKQ